MILHLSLRARFGLALFAAVSIALFAVLAARFGGPSVRVHPPLVLHAALPDSQGLPPNADVLVRGVRVGNVGSIAVRGDRALADLDLGGARPLLWADATVRVGTKTPLGEAFVDLDPGHRAAGPLDARRSLRVRPSVQVDEALGVLAPRARADVRGLLRTSAVALSAPTAPEDLGGALAGVRRAAEELRALTATLHGQDRDIAATVRSAGAVLGELGAHDAAIRGIVADGRRTLRGAGDDPAALRTALTRLPGVLTRARATLSAARPLLREAAPVARHARAASPALTRALRQAPVTLHDARALVTGLPALRAAAAPALAGVRRVLPVAEPAARAAGPVLGDLVPMLRYLAPRGRAIAAWFANTAALGRHGDAKGKWARFLVMFDPATATGSPGGAPPTNAYPAPGDAAHNEPFKPGDYPRLRAFVTGSSSGGP